MKCQVYAFYFGSIRLPDSSVYGYCWGQRVFCLFSYWSVSVQSSLKKGNKWESWRSQILWAHYACSCKSCIYSTKHKSGVTCWAFLCETKAGNILMRFLSLRNTHLDHSLCFSFETPPLSLSLSLNLMHFLFEKNVDVLAYKNTLSRYYSHMSNSLLPPLFINNNSVQIYLVYILHV